VEAHAEECRALRAVAVESGLDPDKAMPEDIHLLMRDKDGNLCVNERRAASAKRCDYFLTRMRDGRPV
jgi:hypothetical protein